MKHRIFAALAGLIAAGLLGLSGPGGCGGAASDAGGGAGDGSEDGVSDTPATVSDTAVNGDFSGEYSYRDDNCIGDVQVLSSFTVVQDGDTVSVIAQADAGSVMEGDVFSGYTYLADSGVYYAFIPDLDCSGGWVGDPSLLNSVGVEAEVNDGLVACSDESGDGLCAIVYIHTY